MSNGKMERIKTLYLDEQMSASQVASRLGMSQWQVYGWLQRCGIPRRHGSEQNYATYKTKPQFRIKSSLDVDDEQLRVAGVMLYAAEGGKTADMVDFANSNPALITVFMRFLREICGVSEARLRVFLYCYADQDANTLRRFWSRVTGVSAGQFTKPYVRPLTGNVNGRKMRHGLVHIRYADKRLLQFFQTWEQALVHHWAGTKAANWTTL